MKFTKNSKDNNVTIGKAIEDLKGFNDKNLAENPKVTKLRNDILAIETEIQKLTDGLEEISESADLAAYKAQKERINLLESDLALANEMLSKHEKNRLISEKECYEHLGAIRQAEREEETRLLAPVLDAMTAFFENYEEYKNTKNDIKREVSRLLSYTDMRECLKAFNNGADNTLDILADEIHKNLTVNRAFELATGKRFQLIFGNRQKGTVDRYELRSVR